MCCTINNRFYIRLNIIYKVVIASCFLVYVNRKKPPAIIISAQGEEDKIHHKN